MNIEIQHRPAYAIARVTLKQGDAFRAESGAMVGMSPNLTMKTSSRTKKGGILRGLGRAFLTGESFFLNTFHAEQGEGELLLAPANVGDLVKFDLDGALYIQASCYVACDPEVEIETEIGGFKNFFGGKGFFMLKATGKGPVLFAAFGAIQEIEVNEPFILDTGHIVAFEPSLDFRIQRVGNWFSTFFSGAWSFPPTALSS